MINSKMGTGARITLMVFIALVVVGGLGLALKLVNGGSVLLACCVLAGVLGCMGAGFPPPEKADELE